MWSLGSSCDICVPLGKPFLLCVMLCVLEVLVCGCCGIYLAQKKLRVELVGWVLVAVVVRVINTLYCVYVNVVHVVLCVSVCVCGGDL